MAATPPQYQNDFRAWDGRLYNISIYISGRTSFVKRIGFGPEPLVVGTSNKHEWMTPVRGGSGYLSVVCDFDTVKDLVATSPTSHKVVLKNVNTQKVVWIGYIQSQTFTDELILGPQSVYQLPLLDCVGVTEQYQVLTTYVDRVHEALALVLPNEDDLMFYFPGNIVRSGETNEDKFPELCAWMSLEKYTKIGETLKYYSPQYYLVKTPDADSSAMEILEDICRFFGWSCVSDGANIYFRSTSTDADCKTMYGFTRQQMSNHTQFLAATPVVIADSIALDDTYTVQPTSAKIDVEQTEPVSSVTINADFNATDVICAPNVKTLAYPEYKNYGECQALTPTEDVLEQYTVAATWIVNGLSDGKMTINYDGNAPVGGQEAAPPNEKKYYPLTKPFLRIYDQFETSELKTKTSPSWIYAINICNRYKCHVGKGATLSLQSDFQYAFADCAITIKGRWKSYSGKKYSESNLFFSFAIGNMYWNGSSWGNTESVLRLYLGDPASPSTTKYEGDIPNLKNVLSEYPGAKGYTMPVVGSLRGRVKLDFFISEYDSGYGWNADDAQLIDVEITATPRIGVEIPAPVYGVSIQGYSRTWEYLDSNTYTKYVNFGGENLKVDLSFATHVNADKYGKAFIYASDGTYLTEIPYISGDARPEEKLLDKYATLYGQPTEWRTVGVRFENIGNLTFEDFCQRVSYANMVWNGFTWSIEATEFNFRDQTIQLTLAKLPDNII